MSTVNSQAETAPENILRLKMLLLQVEEQINRNKSAREHLESSCLQVTQQVNARWKNTNDRKES